MTEARIAREAVVAVASNDTDDSRLRLAREGIAVGHHFPEASTFLRLARLSVNVAISRPHGWHIFDDPPL